MADEIFGSCEWRTTKLPHVTVMEPFGGSARQVKFSSIENQSIVEGDIVIGVGLEKQGLVVVRPNARWPNRTVVYDIDLNLPDPDRVKKAIAHWEQNTPIRFRQRINESDYVLFRNGGGCSSAVGKVDGGGVQWITLGSACSAGNAIHEIGHAVGLWHEQSRADRDSHVTVVWNNIDATYQHNFDQHIQDGQDTGGYDYDSIMHYPKDAFAINPSKPTLVTKNGQAIGQREKLSPADIATVKAIYP